jgi:hypothetical protein
MMIGANFDYLKKCLKLDVFRCSYTSPNHYKTIVRNRRWMQMEIQHHFVRKNNINRGLYELHLSLTKGLSDCEHTRWLSLLSKIEEVWALKIKKKRNRLARKLFKLRATSPKQLNNKGTH